MKKYFLVLAVTLAFAACNNQKKSDPVNGAENNPTAETKVSAGDLVGKNWKLVMIDGKTVVLDSEMGTPHIKFDNTEQVSGNLGCNGFGGSYKADGDQISFAKITATQMACPNLKVEQSFLEVLNTAKTFYISNDTLTLNSGASDAKLVIQ